jgi:hypothetical protein
MVKKTFLTWIALFLGAISLGHSTLGATAPIPESINGAFENGDVLTLKGQNFGARPESSLSIFDTVDNQAGYDGLENGTSVPEDQGLWTVNGSPWAEDITIARQGDHRHANSAASYEGRKKGYLGVPQAFSNSNNTNLYVSWWFKPESDPNGNSGHNKFIRIWDDMSGDFTRISWTQILMGAFETADGSTPSSYQHWGGDVGSWNRLEIFANSKAGTIEAWTNGQVIHSIPDYRKETDATGLTIKLIGFDPNYAEDYRSFVFRMDDIYMASSAARIELSSSKTWADTGRNKELQQSMNWKENSVDFKLSYGQFDPDDQLYVYVIDKNGDVNLNGLPLCPRCPNSPTPLNLD